MTFVHLVTACLIDIWSWSLQLSLNLLSPLILPTASATLCLLWLISPCLFHTLPPAVVCLPYAAAETPMLCSLTLSSLSTSSGKGKTLRSTLSDSSIVIDWFILTLWRGAVEAREQLSFQNSKWCVSIQGASFILNFTPHLSKATALLWTEAQRWEKWAKWPNLQFSLPLSFSHFHNSQALYFLLLLILLLCLFYYYYLIWYVFDSYSTHERQELWFHYQREKVIFSRQ